MSSLGTSRRSVTNNIAVALSIFEVFAESRELEFLFNFLVALLSFRLAGSMGRDRRVGFPWGRFWTRLCSSFGFPLPFAAPCALRVVTSSLSCASAATLGAVSRKVFFAANKAAKRRTTLPCRNHG